MIAHLKEWYAASPDSFGMAASAALVTIGAAICAAAEAIDEWRR
jgi:hypothetical protein